MTSLERKAGSTYGEHKEPSYHAISYTWGRFADSSEKSIQVNNLSWAIPPIRGTHFATEDFEAAIRLAGKGVNFIWLDIACIDQDDPVVKMDEIGKQAAIFRRATKVFVWLAPWKSEDLERSLWTIETFCRSSYELKYGYSETFSMKSSLARTDPTVGSLLEAIQGLVHQPWFTSLWTLQEAYLCKDAILLSRSSTMFLLCLVMDHELEIPITLNWLLVRCQQAFSICISMEDPSANAVCQHLMDSGLLSLAGKNEWTLYAASTKRQASLRNDRIYGIMQIYDISLHLTSSFSALQDKFGFILNSQNPLFAQLHVHDKPPAAGKCWRVSEHMSLPFVFMHALTSRSKSKIYPSPRGIPLITGMSCDFQELLNLWQSAAHHREEHGRAPYQVHVLLDAQSSHASKFLSPSLSPSMQNLSNFSNQWASTVSFEELANYLPLPVDQYSVLLLGSSKMGEDWAFGYAVGLLASQQLEATGKPWVRAGVCAWRDDADYEVTVPESTVGVVSRDGVLEDAFPVPEDLWTSFEGRLG